MHKTDGDLVKEVLAGNNAAFDQLVERHRTAILKLATNRVGAGEDAVDIAQDAFVRAYLSLRTLQEPESFRPWLMTITANLCKMRFRKTREITVPADALELPYSENFKGSDGIGEAVMTLPEKTREAAELFFIKGLKQSEIAASLGISLPAVKARIREARARLQKEMADMTPRSKTKDEINEEFTKGLKQKLELARWYRRLADEIESGANLMAALEALSRDDFSAPLIDATKRMMEAVQAGKSITEALADIPMLANPQASAMVRSGELSGSLHIQFRYLADLAELQNAERNIELIFWCRTLGFLLSSGASIAEIKSYTTGIARSKALQQATRNIIPIIETLRNENPAASELCPVLDKYADVFPPLCRAAMLAGELAGRLDLALLWVADEMADDLALTIASNPLPASRKLSPRAPYIPEVQETLKGSLKLLPDHAPDIRAAAIDITGRLGYTEAASSILPYLQDASQEVRRTAARVVAVLNYKTAEDALVRCLDDPDSSVRKATIESLTKLKIHTAANAIAKRIEDSDHRVLSAAIDSLQELQETESLQTKALDLLQSEDWEAQKRGAYVLRYFLPRELVQEQVDAFTGKLEDLSDTEIRAICALGFYDCIEAKPLLEKLARSRTDGNLMAKSLAYVNTSQSV